LEEFQIFLPSIQDEAREDVVGTTTEGQPTETVKEKEEMEQTSKSSPSEEEHADKMFTHGRRS
jgi:hypothetical protein